MKNKTYIATRPSYRIATPGSPEERVSAIIGDVDGVEGVVAYALHNAELLAAAPMMFNLLKELAENHRDICVEGDSGTKVFITPKMVQDALDAFELVEKLEKTFEKKEYFFQSKGGGFNTVDATSLEQAEKKADDLCYVLDNSVLPGSIKTVEGHESEYNLLLRNFD